MINILLSAVAVAYIRLVAWTSRIERVRTDIRQAMEKSGKGYIYAFWHNRQAFLVYFHEGDRTRTLVSRSSDGEIIARVSTAFGLGSVRGSTSRGGATALNQMREIILSGGVVGITPDGPKGPAGTVQQGILYLTEKTGAPVVPVAYGARRAWHLKSWDRFIVPKPFNRLVMVYGEPFHLDSNQPESARKEQVKRALDAVAAQADALAQAS